MVNGPKGTGNIPVLSRITTIKLKKVDKFVHQCLVRLFKKLKLAFFTFFPPICNNDSKLPVEDDSINEGAHQSPSVILELEARLNNI